MPGAGKEAKKDAELYGEEAKSKFNQLVQDGKQEAHKVDAKLAEYRKDAQSTLNSAATDAQKNANKAIDQFDQKVTEVSDTLFCKPGRDGHRWAGGTEDG